MSLGSLQNKKILLYGFAREGTSTLKYLRKHLGIAEIWVTDDLLLKKLPDEYQQILRADKKTKFLSPKEAWNVKKNQFDAIFKAPGIPKKRVPVRFWSNLTSQTQLFLEKCPGTVIGITGTKGKSTTASLIYEILKSAGKKAVLLGNIGKPPLDYLNGNGDSNVLYVFEMSSHQLFDVTIGPHVAVILNIFPEHLDYYEFMEEYIAAKENITRFQKENDYLIYNADDIIVSKIAAKSLAKKIAFGKDDLDKIRNIGQVGIIGEASQMDILAAVKVAEIFKIPQEVSYKAIQEFQPLAHRLELVGTYRGITFYNDSLATIPQATITALDALGGKVVTILLGGYNRHLDYSDLAKRLISSKIHTIILFPTTGSLIWDSLLDIDKNVFRKFRHFKVKNMEEAVKLAYQHTPSGKICLLSPAAASFGIFKDYADRGTQFKLFVQRYGAE